MTANTQPLELQTAPETATRERKPTGFIVANEYGNVDVRTPLPKRYTHVPGERLPALCRKLNIKFAPALTGFRGTDRYGYSPMIDGVVVSARVAERLREGIAVRDRANARRIEAKQARETAKARREEAVEQQKRAAERKEYEERWAELGHQHGWTQPVPPDDSYRVGPDLLDEPTLELYAAEEWARLGYAVSGDADALLIRPGNPVPLYDRIRVVAGGAESDLPADQLWLLWRRQYATDLLAATKALQAANKLIKIVPSGREVSRELYPLKDDFIRRWLSPHLVSGRVSREEVRSCWCCESGREPGCERCDFTGIYESRTLYEHHFLVDGHDVCFHSYRHPAKLDAIPGADLRQYGFRWALAEMPILRLPELLRVLLWVGPNVLERAAHAPQMTSADLDQAE